MHYQGRRWGEGRTYNSFSTFSSYGVDLDGSAAMRERLVAAVPTEHKNFLQRMQWVHDVERSWGRVVCVHAGLDCKAPLTPQLAALNARDLSASCLFAKGDSGRLLPLCERSAVEPHHPELANIGALLVSGHHGFASLQGDRLILDASGGRPAAGRPIQAVILPERAIIGSDGSGMALEELIGAKEAAGRASVGGIAAAAAAQTLLRAEICRVGAGQADHVADA